MRLGIADAESILRRFTKNNVQHPTYKALCELGKALKTMFLCDYLRLESLRREIHEGLRVIENWNSANDFILYGKGGEFASNKLESQELLMLSLHLLQVSLVYVNTLMIQHVLEEPGFRPGTTVVFDFRMGREREGSADIICQENQPLALYMAIPLTPGPHGFVFLPSWYWSYTESNSQVPTMSSLSVFCCATALLASKAIPTHRKASVFPMRVVNNFIFLHFHLRYFTSFQTE